MFHNKEYIYEIYRSHSFSKAAERLHISQPALSSAVRKVEEKAGAPIFERTTRPISLTPFGEEYIRGIERIEEIEEHLHNIACALHTEPRGTVTIGGSNLGIMYLIPRRFAEYQRRYPEVTLRILEATTLNAKAMLDDGTVDVLITNRPLPTTEYDRFICGKEYLLAAVPKQFPVNERLKGMSLQPCEIGEGIFDVPEERSVSLTEFQNDPFVLLLGENYLRSCCEAMFQEMDMTANIAFEVEKQSVALNFASFGNGITIVSNQLVWHVMDRDSLNFYKIKSQRAIRNTYVCCRKGRFVTNAVKKLVEILTEDISDPDLDSASADANAG